MVVTDKNFPLLGESQCNQRHEVLNRRNNHTLQDQHILASLIIHVLPIFDGHWIYRLNVIRLLNDQAIVGGDNNLFKDKHTSTIPRAK